MNEIQNKIGDLPIPDVRKAVYKLVKSETIAHSPDKTYRKYWLVKKK